MRQSGYCESCIMIYLENGGIQLSRLAGAHWTKSGVEKTHAVEERKLYDRMVCGHHWPDYKRLNPVCEVAVVTPSDG